MSRVLLVRSLGLLPVWLAVAIGASELPARPACSWEGSACERPCCGRVIRASACGHETLAAMDAVGEDRPGCDLADPHDNTPCCRCAAYPAQIVLPQVSARRIGSFDLSSGGISPTRIDPVNPGAVGSGMPLGLRVPAHTDPPLYLRISRLLC